jgi:quercetin dioxygenase-like cupin family protein
MLLVGLGFPAQPVAIAQEATPAADMEPEGVTFEPVTFSPAIDLPAPGQLFVFRTTLEPGAVVPIEETDPTLGILLVESGTLTVRSDGTMTVTRGAGFAEAIATAEAAGEESVAMESVAAGEAVTLEAGDAVYIPSNSAGELRNDGQEPVVSLGFLVIPLAGMPSEATPEP